MTTVMSTTAKRDMAALLGAGALGRLSDAELLARFASGRGDPASQAAFEAILTRHGPMVLGVCRRVLGDSHAAADAFQATFLVLTRKARTVSVEDSLGRWLHGVSVRVARRARAVARAERARVRAIEGDGPAEDAEPAPSPERDDLRRVIDEEIARLPARYRSPVVLCYLEGLSQEQAARRLRCPLGTVQSRLHRARERLRSGLVRRGLAPAGWGSAVLAATVARADVPKEWVEASRDGAELAGAVSAAVSSLARWTLRGMLMSQIGRLGMILAGLALPVAGAFTIAARGDDKPAGVSRPDDVVKRGNSEETIGREPSPSERFKAIRDEYNARQSELWRAVEKAKDRREENELYRTRSPDEVAYCRRMIDLALSAPDDPAARDALVWIIDKPGMSDVGPYGTEFGRAAGMLVRHFGDDPEAIRVGLGLDNVLSPRREALLFGFVAAAKGRESKGLARLALAQFLERRAGLAAGAKKVQGRPKGIVEGFVDEDGKVVDKVIEQSDEEHAYYVLQLRLTDPDATRAEAERLFEEVVADYGDVPHVTVQTRKLEALLKEPTPTWNGKPMTAEEIQKLKGHLALTSTLGQVAEGHLDEMHNLAVGKPAPEIDGVDFAGKPLKLSDYRGKVVALVFWGTWCGPCMREVPRERELVEKLKAKPFAMLGVNCDEDKEAALKAIESERITWPNWHDGDPDIGPIVARYHVSGFPTVMVLDGQGIIRHKKVLGDQLDKVVDDLIKELEGKAESSAP